MKNIMPGDQIRFSFPKDHKFGNRIFSARIETVYDDGHSNLAVEISANRELVSWYESNAILISDAWLY